MNLKFNKLVVNIECEYFVAFAKKDSLILFIHKK
jgi:hypothetical protein